MMRRNTIGITFGAITALSASALAIAGPSEKSGPAISVDLPSWAIPRTADPAQIHEAVEPGPNLFQKYARTIRFTVSEANGGQAWRENRSILYTAAAGEDCGIGEHLTSQSVDPTGKLHVIDSVERWFFRDGRLYAHVYNGTCTMDPVSDVPLPGYLPVLDFPQGLRAERDPAARMVALVPAPHPEVGRHGDRILATAALSRSDLAAGSYVLEVAIVGEDGKSSDARMKSLWVPIGESGPVHCMAQWMEVPQASGETLRIPVRLTSFFRYHGETPAHIETVTYSFPAALGKTQAEIDELAKARDVRVTRSIDTYRLLESRPTAPKDPLRLAQVEATIVFVLPPGAPNSDAGFATWEFVTADEPPRVLYRFDDEALEWRAVAP